MTVSDRSLGKTYKLCSKKTIDTIFSEGTSIKVFPLIARFHVQNLDSNEKFQIAVSVPKKNFKKAVERNRIKRLILEAIREHKIIFEELTQVDQLAIFIIYSSKEELPLSKIKTKTKKLFQTIVTTIEQNQ